ncbi:MAG TPA: hypothetical protein VM764_06880 [Gemmatimonadaceae bacterium]|nr:hypothetical protein [Gemmatimonadaceae bacterium]
MGQLTVLEYDAVERAIIDGSRLSVRRRGGEFLVIPESLVVRDRRESLIARHPTTGARLVIHLDEVEGIEVVPRR